MTKWGELPMGRCSLLVGLRISSQSLDQLVLMFREFWRISWRFRGDMMSLTSSAWRRLSAVGQVIDVDDKQYRAYDRSLGDTAYGRSHLG